MINKIDDTQCCLCRGCADACPVDAIQFSREKDGFLYPAIDTEKCIGCNRCEQVCPVMKRRINALQNEPKAFAARSKERTVRLQSTSGGIFYEAAMQVLQCGGYVCGAVFDEAFQVRHVVTKDVAVVNKMCGSKYAQSNNSGIYKEIQALLKDGKRILFSGCPCQCAALKSFLGRDYENLWVLDFVCHGIPSQRMLDDYCKYLEERYHSKIKSLSFRSKEAGWHSSSVKVNFENHKAYCEPIVIDAYMRSFLSGAVMKEACYTCRFKSFTSGSDLTLGDFWGAEVTHPELDDNLGLSAVFTHSEKGMTLLSSLPNVELVPVPAEEIIRYNQNVVRPSEPSAVRKEFLAYAQVHGFGNAIEYYFQETKTERLKRKTRYLLRCVYYKCLGKEKPLY